MALYVTTESINARSRKLMDEFEEHWEQVQASSPEVADKEAAFAIWQTQKIAGLQEICTEMSRRIACLTELVVGDGGPVFQDLIEEAA